MLYTRSLGYAVAVGITLMLSWFAMAGRPQPAAAENIPTTATASGAYPLYNTAAISAALDYLRTQQLPNGGIDAFGSGGANDGGTARLVLAMAAGGRPVAALTSSAGNTPIDFLRSRAISYTYDANGTGPDNVLPQQAGLLLAAAATAGEDSRNFGGVDLVNALEANLRPGGAYSTTATGAFISGAAGPLNQAWSIIGLTNAGRTIPISATDFLAGLQQADGSWGGIDTSGIAVTALLGSGNVAPTDPVIQDALAFFAAMQTSSGGWKTPFDTGPTNANSTAWGIQALVSAGYVPASESWGGENNPRRALQALQQPDGSIGGAFVNAYSTLEAIYGLAERPISFGGSAIRVERGLSWLQSVQQADGSWAESFGSPAGPAIDGALAFAAAGYDPATVRRSAGDVSLFDYLATQAVSYTQNVSGTLPGNAGKLIMGVVAGNGDPTSFGTPTPINLVENLTTTLKTSGAYSSTAQAAGSFNQALAILGLSAAGETVPISATEYLTSLQNADGGWSFAAGGSSSADTTGLVVQALIAGGVAPGAQAVEDGINFLRANQDEQGGWGNPSSTAYAIQGLLAAGADIDADWLRNGRGPLEALKYSQKSDGPFVFTWDADGFLPGNDDLFATRQALPALIRRSLPITGELAAFTATPRGPDPDRTVFRPGSVRLIEQPAAARLAQGSRQLEVRLPFGSDLNNNADVRFEWRAEGNANWQAVTLSRAEGYFSATLTVPAAPLPIEYRGSISDTEQVQFPDGASAQQNISGQIDPQRVWLPLVYRPVAP
jgi:hypothetical protein